MAEFIPNAGYENCPKCGGWQVLDKTIRKKNGWPVGPIVMADCDNCAGAGQIKLPDQPKPITIRDNSGLVKPPSAVWSTPAPQPAPIKIEASSLGWGTPKSNTVKTGWAVFDEKQI